MVMIPVFSFQGSILDLHDSKNPALLLRLIYFISFPSVDYVDESHDRFSEGSVSSLTLDIHSVAIYDVLHHTAHDCFAFIE